MSVNLTTLIEKVDDLSICIELSKNHSECIVCLIEDYNVSLAYKISKILHDQYNYTLLPDEKQLNLFYTNPDMIKIEFMSPYENFKDDHNSCFVINFTD